ncbi:MAG: tRNA uridine-5-carboxymethylaminomethyl(34) synthesis GTPase MnmE, partial [Buchnera aphidicola]|nr:tRNA uridine-5-carboxymethylaminomethyl(34) synthesis GTPase MnmE [Buchnera aphidicola]
LARKKWRECQNIELLAESVKFLNQYLNNITGSFTSHDLLDRIFSTFCIGK